MLIMARRGKSGRPSKRRAEFRSQVLARDPLCKVCGERASVEADHIVPLARGGLDHPDNMRGVCRGCHRRKTKKDWAMVKAFDREGNEIPEVFDRIKKSVGKRKRGRPGMLSPLYEGGGS